VATGTNGAVTPAGPAYHYLLNVRSLNRIEHLRVCALLTQGWLVVTNHQKSWATGHQPVAYFFSTGSLQASL
jgi:hypothetical protein